jgi:hypothetical protein
MLVPRFLGTMRKQLLQECEGLSGFVTAKVSALLLLCQQQGHRANSQDGILAGVWWS